MTPVPEVSALHQAFRDGITRPHSWRKHQLRSLRRLLFERESDFVDAVHQDLQKSGIETLKAEIDYTLKRFERWLKPQRAPVPLKLQPASVRITREPLGVVLIIAPWNHLFQLLLAPQASALAARNAAVLRPSELAPATSSPMVRLLPQYPGIRAVQVVESGAEETTALRDEKSDHIFFTGKTRVAHHAVQPACARSCVGRGPRRSVPRRPGGQHRLRENRLRTAPAATLTVSSGRICTGRKERYENTRYFSPTLLTDVDPGSPIMIEEELGPLLSIVRVSDVTEAIAFINARDKPLAFYVSADPTVSGRGSKSKRVPVQSYTEPHSCILQYRYSLRRGGIQRYGGVPRRAIDYGLQPRESRFRQAGKSECHEIYRTSVRLVRPEARSFDRV